MTETLTPKQMVEAGWTINITHQPNYGANNFSDSTYAKPDKDDPSDVIPAGDPVKERARANEVVVFELAPPDDATDEEFAAYPSLLEAFWSGAHADGYFGVGDVLTLKVRTRMDNLPEDESVLEDMQAAYAQQIRTWDGGESTVYATVHDTTMDWLDPTKGGVGWTHGSQPAKPTVQEAKLPEGVPANVAMVPYGFAAQDLARFRFVNKQEDHEQYTDTATGQVVEAVDYDRDSQFTDVYTAATSGYFKIRKPSASVRADTFDLRRLMTDPDFALSLADDAHGGGSNQFYVTQAVNTGGAVNRDRKSVV
nr:hypothetical protein [uncultured Adlercreutzia sp.]